MSKDAALFVAYRIYLSLSLCIFLCLSLSLCIFLCLSVSFSVSLRLSLSVSLAVSLYISLFVSLCLSLSLCLCVSLSVSFSVSLFLSLFCLSACLPLSSLSLPLLPRTVKILVCHHSFIIAIYFASFTPGGAEPAFDPPAKTRHSSILIQRGGQCVSH